MQSALRLAVLAAAVVCVLGAKKVAVFEGSPGRDVFANMATIETVVRTAAGRGAKYINTPEYFAVPDDVINPFLGGAKVWEAIANFGKGAFGMLYHRLWFVPNVAWLRCGDETAPITYPEDLGCLAKKYNVHLGVNMMTEDGFGRFYNTHVIFGPDGNAQSIYHKINPTSAELHIAPGDAPRETAVAGLGRSGQMVCLDILYPGLRSNTAEVEWFSTEWTSLGPLISVGVQQGFSRDQRVAVLAANINKEPHGHAAHHYDHTGSSIVVNGQVLASTFGELADGGRNYQILEADLATATANPFPHDTAGRNNGPVRAASGADWKGNTTTVDMRELYNQASITLDLSVGGLHCVIKIDKKTHGAKPQERDYPFVYKAQSMYGRFKKTREIRVCTIFSVPRAGHESSSNWKKFDFKITADVKNVEVVSSAHGRNVATTPITTYQVDDNGKYRATPLDIATFDSRFTVEDDDKSKLTMKLKNNGGFAMMATGVYGVVNTAAAAFVEDQSSYSLPEQDPSLLEVEQDEDPGQFGGDEAFGAVLKKWDNALKKAKKDKSSLKEFLSFFASRRKKETVRNRKELPEGIADFGKVPKQTTVSPRAITVKQLKLALETVKQKSFLASKCIGIKCGWINKRQIAQVAFLELDSLERAWVRRCCRHHASTVDQVQSILAADA